MICCRDPDNFNKPKWQHWVTKLANKPRAWFPFVCCYSLVPASLSSESYDHQHGPWWTPINQGLWADSWVHLARLTTVASACPWGIIKRPRRWHHSQTNPGDHRFTNWSVPWRHGASRIPTADQLVIATRSHDVGTPLSTPPGTTGGGSAARSVQRSTVFFWARDPHVFRAHRLRQSLWAFASVARPGRSWWMKRIGTSPLAPTAWTVLMKENAAVFFVMSMVKLWGSLKTLSGSL